MRHLLLALLLCAFVAQVPAKTNPSPLEGRWNFNHPSSGGNRASWLGIAGKDGKLDVWYQPTGGNVYQVKDFTAKDSHLTLTLSPTHSWELDVKGDQMTGVQKRDGKSTPLAGTRAPELKRHVPTAWTAPEPIFNGKNLDGWEPIGDPAASHWGVKDGMLVNEAHGANLKSIRTFEDFKVHFEVNCPDHANSGFYLRGRYEVQIESEPLENNPVERRIGGIYGRIAPKVELPRKPGEWNVFDVTLVNRTVTVVRNGVTLIDRQEIEGITGGALDANEATPGPFYIQGDHTGGLKFRNITVSLPKR